MGFYRELHELEITEELQRFASCNVIGGPPFFFTGIYRNAYSAYLMYRKSDYYPGT